MQAKLQGVLDEYKKKNKDYIFLVNEDIKPSQFINKKLDVMIKRHLEQIFDQHMEPNDRLSLMTYGKNTKKLFNLV